MSLWTAVGNFTARTTVGTTAITGLTGQPKALFVWSGIDTAAGNAAGQRFAFGFANSTASRCMVIAADDNAATSNEGRVQNHDLLRLVTSGTPTLDAVMTLSSFDANGFTVNWPSDPASSAFIIHYLALGGDDITNTYVGTITNASSGAFSVTAPGFKPDLLVGAHVYANNDVFSGTGGQINIWAAANGTSITQGLVAAAGRDGVADSNQNAYQRSDRTFCGITTSGNAVEWEGSVTSFDATGFSGNITTGTGTVYLPYIAIKGGNYKVVADTEKTSTTGTKSKTGVGFQPVGAMFLGTGRASSTTLSSDSTAGRLSMGASDGTNEGAIGFHNTDAAATMDTNRRISTTKAYFSLDTPSADTLSVHGEFDIQSFDVDGYTANYTTVGSTAREFLVVLFGGSALTITATAGTVTLSVPNSTTLIRDTATAGTVTLSAANSTGTGRQTATAGSLSLSSPGSVGRLTHPVTAGSIALSSGDSSTANRTSAGTLTVSSPDSATVTSHSSTAGQITLSQGAPTGAAVELATAGTVTMSMGNPTEATLGLASSGTLSLSMADPTSRVMLSATSASISMSAGDSAGTHVAPVQSATLTMSFTDHTTDIPVVAGPSDVWNPRRRRRI